MDQLLIRRCALRLHRSGGWSWGPDPNRLVQTATRLLPDLISKKLAHLLAHHQEPLTIDRLSIRIPVKLSELIEMELHSEEQFSTSVFSERISLRCQQALAVHTRALDVPDEMLANKEPELATVIAVQIESGHAARNHVLTLLITWYEHGKLIRLLPFFSELTLAAWENLALDSLSSSTDSTHFEREWLEFVAGFHARLRESPFAKAAIRSQRLLLLAALLHQFPRQIPRSTMRDLLGQLLPIDDLGNGSSGEPLAVDQVTDNGERVSRRAELDLQQPQWQQTSTGPRACTAANFELRINSVLPFIAIGVLSRLGYFDVVSTAFSAAKCATDLPGFVVALSYKMLPSPRRGCLRSDADRRTAAAAAGLQECLSDAELERVAYRCADCLSPADGFLQLLLVEGHDPSQAMLVHRLVLSGQPAWVLLDSQGSFVVGWFYSIDALLRALDDFVGNLVLISEAAADSSLLQRLAPRHRFVTSVPPASGDRWRPVDRRRTLWTNDSDSSTDTLLRQSQCLPAVTESAERVTTGLLASFTAQPKAPATPAQPKRQDSVIRLDRSLALAAASALGVIAWELWGDHESTDALLAIERFGDLDGKVSVGSDRIVVRPALGKRYQDLSRHDLLRDVENLPWLDGRRLEFAGL